MITQEQRMILNEMISDLNQTNIKEYKPSETLWLTISNRFEESFNSLGIGNIQNQNIYNGLFSFIFDNTGLTFQTALWSYYSYLKSKDKYNLLEKTTALPSGNSNLDYNPYSEIVGRPGIASDCRSEVTAKGLNFPDFTNGIAAGMVAKKISTCPPKRSFIARPPPLYGIWVMLTPPIESNKTPAKCADDPLPAEG
jgi:hypothetical protein